MPQNTPNIAPVPAGPPFSPKPRTTKKSQKWCQMVPRSDPKPSKMLAGNMLEITSKSRSKKNENMSPKDSPKVPQRDTKIIKKWGFGLTWTPHGPRRQPKVPNGASFAHFASIFFIFWMDLVPKIMKSMPWWSHEALAKCHNYLPTTTRIAYYKNAISGKSLCLYAMCRAR